MKIFKVFMVSLLPLLMVAVLLTGNVQAALLDVGPTVPEVNPSTEPTLGHGFPLWYRDNNRVPLQLCTDRNGMCLTAEPFPLLPLSFPDNLSDELFWWVGDAIIDIPQQGALTRPGQAILVQAVEAAFSTGGVVSGAQISFARIRIRIDVPFAGEYTVTTPFKEFTFTVAADTIADGISYVEDIGVSEGGIFTGALNGNVGPFLYCTNAPIVRAEGSYVGDPNVLCPVLGSTFPSAQNPTNFFRVQGPNGFDVQTNLFSVSGKLYTEPLPTPLTVDRVTYTRESLGAQVSGFATTQPLSNQTAPGLGFPARFALTGAPSTLQITGSGVPTVSMTSNSPADGKFFGSSGLFPDLGSLPATVSVTNTADTPQTVKVVPLVDEVVVDAALYNPVNGTLTVSAFSYDRIAVPSLSLYLPGIAAPIGALVNGQFSVTFPITDSSVNPVKTYNIPPETVTVVSAIGGSGTQAVTSLPPVAINHAPVAVNDAAGVAGGGTAIINVAANDTDPDPGDILVEATVLLASQPLNGAATLQPDGTISYTPNNGFLGADIFSYTIRDGFGALSNVAVVTVTIFDSAANTAPVAVDDAVVTTVNTPVTFNITTNDTDAQNNLLRSSILSIASPAHGTLRAVGTNGGVSYTPDLNYTGPDQFTYTVSDSLGLLSNVATVTITVNAVTNSAPVAVNDAAVTAANTPITFNITTNDTDADNNLLRSSILSIASPSHGTLRGVGTDGSVSYTPNLDYTGPDQFTYTVSDSLGLVSNVATVTITVNVLNALPLAAADTAATNEDTPVTFSVTANDTDPDGAFAVNSVQIVTQPPNGTVSAAADGTVTYTPNANFFGVNTFNYTVSDGVGVSAPATVTVTVIPVNDPPTAVNDVVTVPAGIPIAINVVGNDQDIDGTVNVASVTIIGQPANGSVTVNLDGTVTYASTAGFNGTDSFSYTVLDNTGAVSAPATVSVSVSAAAAETVTVLRAQVRLSTREWRVDGVITTPTSTSVNVYIGRDLTGTLLGSAAVLADGTWILRLNGSGANPLPDATNTISVQGQPGGGSRLAFPLSVR